MWIWKNQTRKEITMSGDPLSLPDENECPDYTYGITSFDSEDEDMEIDDLDFSE